MRFTVLRQDIAYVFNAIRLTGRLVTEWMKDSETYHAVCQGVRNIDFTYTNGPGTNKGQRNTVTVMHKLMLDFVVSLVSLDDPCHRFQVASLSQCVCFVHLLHFGLSHKLNCSNLFIAHVLALPHAGVCTCL